MKTSFVNQFLYELSYFTNRKGIRLLPPASNSDLLAAEKELNYNFCPQMAFFLTHINGGRILEVAIKGVNSLGIRKIPKGLDIVNDNLIMRTFDGWTHSWLLIGEDGFGNYYVMDNSRVLEDDEHPILFVDHEAIGEDWATYEFATSYSEFLIKLVLEMKKIYTPDGNIKDLENRP